MVSMAQALPDSATAPRFSCTTDGPREVEEYMETSTSSKTELDIVNSLRKSSGEVRPQCSTSVSGLIIYVKFLSCNCLNGLEDTFRSLSRKMVPRSRKRGDSQSRLCQSIEADKLEYRDCFWIILNPHSIMRLRGVQISLSILCMSCIVCIGFKEILYNLTE